MAEQDNLPGSRQREIQILAEKLQSGQLEPDQQRLLSQLLEDEPGSVVMSVTRQQVHMGPLPPAELLNEYDETTRHTIVGMADKEQSHAHEMQRLALDGVVHLQYRPAGSGGGVGTEPPGCVLSVRC